MKYRWLLLGDLLTLALVTLVGFVSHAEFAVPYLPRMAASFLPLCIAWFLLAPLLGLFRDAVINEAPQLWRPGFVMLFAGPLAALLRGIALNTLVVASFAIVLSLTAALGLTIWRLLWLLVMRRSR
jgi:hypothetical protein